ncbi:uncharacterized protein LOC133861526 [Alnus glutinosa]|uniref:uncharacterized protein LOC133861526 n=1 Tax=Alnus glutinosa TaxID=3517 RepID=UPI002D79760C|nr:uncharacterized protein LOC133861526 [Alnus glutinosa]
MATLTKFCAALSMFIFFAILHGRSSTCEPAISASPAVLPYVTAPNMSSFFPSPSDQRPLSSAAPPNSAAFAPVPSSGEFVGKSSSNSARFHSGITICGVGLVSLFLTRLISSAVV